MASLDSIVVRGKFSLTGEEVRQLLIETINGYGSQSEFARSLGLSKPYINDLVHGRKRPSNKVLKKLGLRREVVYVVD